MFIVDLIEYLISNKKHLVYSTFDMNDYYKVAARLKASSVKYRVSTYADTPPAGFGGPHNNQYKIYVKKEDEHKANRAIHDK